MDARFYGRAIRKVRLRDGRKLVEFAQEVEMHPNTLSALETKGQGMRMDLFIQLCTKLGADPVEVADLAYFNFRRQLRAETEKAMQQPATELENVIPSLEEITKLHESATGANLRLLLGVLRRIQPDHAVSAFVLDQLRDMADAEPPPDASSKKRPRTRSRRKNLEK